MWGGHGDDCVDGVGEIVWHCEHRASNDAAHAVTDDDDGLGIRETGVVGAATGIVVEA